MKCFEAWGRLLPRDIHAFRHFLPLQACFIHIKDLLGLVPPILDDGPETIWVGNSGALVSALSLSRELYVIEPVTSPFHKSHLNWVHDPAPPPSRRLESTDTVARSDSRVNSSVPIPRNPLAPIPSASWNNSSVSDPSVPHPSNSVRSNSRRVSKHKKSENEVSAIATRGSSTAPLSSAPPKKRRMRRRRQARRAANRNSGDTSAAPLTQDARWANQRAAVPAGATQPQPENSDPTSTRRTAVYPPSRIVGDSLANENLPFQIGLESSRIPGLYKPAIPDQHQDTQARTFRVNNSG